DLDTSASPGGSLIPPALVDRPRAGPADDGLPRGSVDRDCGRRCGDDRPFTDLYRLAGRVEHDGGLELWQHTRRGRGCQPAGPGLIRGPAPGGRIPPRDQFDRVSRAAATTLYGDEDGAVAEQAVDAVDGSPGPFVVFAWTTPQRGRELAGRGGLGGVEPQHDKTLWRLEIVVEGLVMGRLREGG